MNRAGREVSLKQKADLPLPVKIFNKAGSVLRAMGAELISLEKENLLKTARKRAGLENFGEPWFHEPLGRFLESLEKDAALTPMGRIIAREGILQMLENRLRVEDHAARHPEFENGEIRRPLVIVGLPRSGTTILHSLLDQDPANRAPLSWECLSPMPPPRPETYGSDPRIAGVQKQFDQIYRLAPGFEAVHPMAADMPQECVAIWSHCFMTPQYHVQFNVSGYQKWLDRQDMSRVYRYYRRFLKLLQSGGVKGDRWLLKSPGHLHCYDSLLEIFPDAGVIFTHRDPVTVVASLTSLTCMLRSISSDHVDPVATGRNELEWWEYLMGRSVELRKKLVHKKDQFFDLHLSEIVKDPLGAVERIYRHFDMELTGEVRNRMKRFMAENPREKHGNHTYRAEDFGINPVRERERFTSYYEMLRGLGIPDK